MEKLRWNEYQVKERLTLCMCARVCVFYCAGTTAYITFDEVRVPVENLIGEEHRGFKYIMQNFNHERFVLAAQANRFARVCLEEAIKWARQRRTFNTAHINHQVIRHKIGEMARRIESTHAWLEQLAYQYQHGGSDSKVSSLRPFPQSPSPTFPASNR